MSDVPDDKTNWSGYHEPMIVPPMPSDDPDFIAKFMAADVQWYSPPEYESAFDRYNAASKMVPTENKDHPMTEAAWTETTAPVYPAYVNVQFGPTPPAPGDPLGQRTSPDTILLHVRAPAERRPSTPATHDHPGSEETIVCGKTVLVSIPLEAWDQLMLDVQRMRGQVG